MENDQINARAAAYILGIAALNGGREAPPPPPPPAEIKEEPYDVFLDPRFVRVLFWLTVGCIIWIMVEGIKLKGSGQMGVGDGGYNGGNGGFNGP